MKVIKVKKCEDCPYLMKEESYWNEAFCKNRKAPEFNTVDKPSSIPKWCPLEDL